LPQTFPAWNSRKQPLPRANPVEKLKSTRRRAQKQPKKSRAAEKPLVAFEEQAV
jgi:hypothetical protein